MPKAIWSGIFLLCAVMFIAASEMDYQSAKETESLYCEMVTANIESGGLYGWHDYNGNYQEICK